MLRVITAPTEDLVSLEEVKVQLRIDHEDEDQLLKVYARVAVEQVEAEVQRRYLTQTLEWVIQGRAYNFLPRRLALPVAPVTAVDFVKYVDTAGVLQTLAPASYDLKPMGQGAAIVLRLAAFAPILGEAAEPVVIRFRAGAAAKDVPQTARLAVLLTAENLYDNRSAAEPPDIVKGMLISERWEA